MNIIFFVIGRTELNLDIKLSLTTKCSILNNKNWLLPDCKKKKKIIGIGGHDVPIYNNFHSILSIKRTI